MVKIATSKGFDPGRSAFFMPSGTGPCRFGQYNMLHRLVLDELGLHDVPIYAPNQDEGLYKDLGMVGNSFVRSAWNSVVSWTCSPSACTRPGRTRGKKAGRRRSTRNASAWSATR